MSDNLKCDALVVGAGITGSLVAERLTRQGLDVVIIDRELPGRGSTAASTAMLLWEIDRPLRQLMAYGFERAARAYRASLHAVAGLNRWCASSASLVACATRIRCISRRARAAPDWSKSIACADARGLPGDFLDHGMLLDAYGLARAGAIVSSGAADADPMQLARGLLGWPWRAALVCSRAKPSRSMRQGAR